MIRISMTRNWTIRAVLLFLFSQPFLNSNAQDAIKLHLDKNVYSPGHVIHLKGYVIDESRVENDNGFFITLTDTKNRNIKTIKRIRSSQLINGMSFPLDMPVTSGIYRLEVLSDKYNLLHRSSAMLIIDPDDQEFISGIEPVERVNIFIEGGGPLIAGQENTIVVEYLHGNRSENESFVLVKDPQDSVILKRMIPKSGLTRIKIAPEYDAKYNLSIVSDNVELINQAFPSSQKSGIIAHVEKLSRGDGFLLNLSFVNSSYSGHTLQLIKHGKILKNFEIPKNSFTREFTASDLPSGIIQFKVLNNNDEVVKSRLVFNHKPEPLRITITMDKSTYSPGKMIKLNVKAVNKVGSDVPIDASISVTDLNQTEDLLGYKQNIWTSEFSRLKHLVSNPQNYFDPSLSADWSLDDLMITAEKNESVVNIERGEKDVFEGINVSGKVIDANSNTLPRGVLLTMPDLNGVLQYEPTDPDGGFLFNDFDFSGDQKVYLTVWPPNPDAQYVWDVKQPKPYLDKTEITLDGVDMEKLTRMVRYSRIEKRLKEQYYRKLNKEDAIDEKQVVSKRGLSNVDKRILMDSYISFPNMKTVIKEVIPYTQIRKTGFKVFSPELRRTFEGEPLILLDGIPVSDSVILSQDPIILDKIELVNTFKNIYKIGKAAENGIVAFYTRPGHSVDEVSAFKINLKGYYQEEVTIQQAQKFDDGVPRLPAVLFWNSHLKLDGITGTSIEFLAPDYATELNVHVEGLSSEGNYGIFEQTITISH